MNDRNFWAERGWEIGLYINHYDVNAAIAMAKAISKFNGWGERPISWKINHGEVEVVITIPVQ